MSLSFTRSSLLLGTLLVSMGVSADAHGSGEGQQEIPAEFTRPTNPPEVPTPECVRCRVKFVTSTQDAPEGGALLDLHYDDDYGNFQGKIELTMLLGCGQYRTQMIDNVDMLNDETSVFDLTPGATWNWADDVDLVFVRLVPDPSPS